MSFIFLIGMPAAGKTFWGSRVAAEYQCQFIDMDTLIEEREKIGISAIFEKHGEDGFRKIERKILQKAISNNKTKTIVACGGGTPCYADNILLMKQAGCVIYLKAGIEILLKNLLTDPNERPLLQNMLDAEGHLEYLLAERHTFYEQADFILPVENLSLVSFNKIIYACTNPQ